jgi:hypothetical protein
MTDHARFRIRALSIAAAALAFVLLSLQARAAVVSGTLVTYEGQKPETNRSLHFLNRATRDIYMAPTQPDGSFGTNLPPGIYNLRAERGAILRRNIVVTSQDVPLGQVSELAPYAPARLFDYQYIAPSILSFAAPSTANILTLDTTPIPAGAIAMPKPRSELPMTPEFAPPAPETTRSTSAPE